MKCFVHFNQEAIAACRTCGKGMCASCSAYSNHSVVCPYCLKKEFEKEVTSLNYQNKQLKWGIFTSAALTFLLCWTVVFGFWFGYKWYKNHAELKNNENRIAYLLGEISKLENARRNRSTSNII